MAAPAAIAAPRSANTWSSPPEDVVRHLIPQSCCSGRSDAYACGLAGNLRGEIVRGETRASPKPEFTVTVDMLAATARERPERPGHAARCTRGGLPADR